MARKSTPAELQRAETGGARRVARGGTVTPGAVQSLTQPKDQAEADIRGANQMKRELIRQEALEKQSKT
jgi:hypothetical protein